MNQSALRPAIQAVIFGLIVWPADSITDLIGRLEQDAPSHRKRRRGDSRHHLRFL